jgi:HEAT repeat protein
MMCEEDQMKSTIAIFAAALVLLTPVLAQESESPNFDREKVVKNLVQNLNSENKGVRESSAFMLGELKLSEGLIPLLAVLHNDPNESSRIVAALSLSKIGAARGTFAVKQAALFDDSKRVRLICAWFSNMYNSPQPFQFMPLNEAQELQLATRWQEPK